MLGRTSHRARRPPLVTIALMSLAIVFALSLVGNNSMLNEQHKQLRRERAIKEEQKNGNEMMAWVAREGGLAQGVALHRFDYSSNAEQQEEEEDNNNDDVSFIAAKVLDDTAVPGVRGLIATRNIDGGEVIAKIPRGLMLTPVDPVMESFGKLSENHGLAVRLALEFQKGKNSKWYPYIKMLPTMTEYQRFHLLVATNDVLQDFRGIPLTSWIYSARNATLEFYTHHQKELLKKRIGWDLLWWAYVTQLSRCYGVTINGVSTIATVPITDMGNTAWPKERIQTQWGWNATHEAFLLTATRPIRKGEEVFESYEVSYPKDNAWLAYMFGFVVSNNPHTLSQGGKNLGADAKEICARIRSLKKRPRNGQWRLMHDVAMEYCKGV